MQLQTQLRWMLTIVLVCVTILVAGYTLTQVDSPAEAAAPAVSRSIMAQATTVEEVQARAVQPLAGQQITVVDNLFGFDIRYPAHWVKQELSSKIVILQAADESTQLKIEAAGLLPADGLTGFVNRSLGSDIVLTRQQLTIHGLPTERILLFSNGSGGQVTKFFINANSDVYVISGAGQQKSIEAVARSFNAPQEIALR